MTLTKANLIDSVFNQSDLQKQESTPIVESLLEVIKRPLESGEDVLISGFGKFCVKDKKERKGRNPDTGGDMKWAQILSSPKKLDRFHFFRDKIELVVYCMIQKL